jgi:hypothetical protein
MNEISLINDYIINQLQQDVLVNTISIVPTLTLDLNKENIYPLVNFDMKDIEIQDQVIVVSFTFTVLQQRDVRPIKTDSKLLTNTNYIDNINETHSITQRFVNILNRQNNTENIEIQSLSTLRLLKSWNQGELDGVQFDIDLSIPNIGSSC